MISLEGALIVVGWLVSLFVATMIVPKLAANRVSERFGLKMVSQDDKKFYAPVGPDGEPVKIPIGVKENKETGEQEVILGYAPLAFALPYMAADMAAMKVKMALMGTKSGLSRKIKGALLEEGAAGRLDPDAMLPFLPKKAQAAIAVLRALGLGVGPVSPQNRDYGANAPQTGYRGGQK